LKLRVVGRPTCHQARNQLGTPGGAKSFPRGAQIFGTMSNVFKRRPTHFSRGGEKFLGGNLPPCVPPGYEPACHSVTRHAVQRGSI